MAVNFVSEVDNRVTIRRVIVSVSDKSGLDTFIPGLIEVNPDIRILSTGGTYAAIERILGGERARRILSQVSDYTGQPETQGGLVKTLDFKIYLGLLTETYNPSHQEDMIRTEADPIDMVVVNLYPFGETVKKADATVEMARANIDIGGPTMIRAAAKNYLRVCPVVDPGDYGGVIKELEANGGWLDLAARFRLARKAFAHTADYDRAISAYLHEQKPEDAASVYELKN